MIATYHGTSMGLLSLAIISLGLWFFAEFKGRRLHRLSSGVAAIVLVTFFVWCEATRPRDGTIMFHEISLSYLADIFGEGKNDEAIVILRKYEEDLMLKDLSAEDERREAERLNFELLQLTNEISNKSSEPKGSR